MHHRRPEDGQKDLEIHNGLIRGWRLSWFESGRVQALSDSDIPPSSWPRTLVGIFIDANLAVTQSQPASARSWSDSIDG
jgi:hypothetical protein